jgi:hemerythrin-like domain-containing protein
MTRLEQDHLRLARLLDLFDALLIRFHEGLEPDYQLMEEMLEYMADYADRFHHPTEDLIFRRALDKGVERRDVFEVLMHQHRLVAELNKRFRTALDGIVHEEVLLRQEVEAHGRELVQTLRQHMVLEDGEAFPLCLDRLDPADWEAVEALAPDAEDPLFGKRDPQRFRALYLHLNEQAHG